MIRYLGIPIANTPRFQPPEPIPPWNEVLQATTPSPAPPQAVEPVFDNIMPNPFLDNLVLDESKLCLSITTPTDIKPDEKLNVMIWIYGGAFITGGGDGIIYNPSHLVAEHRVIVVNINYRLGLWGYLGDGDKRTANLGVLDQLLALQWVKTNIAAFGGSSEPQSTTIFGQSAGGSSVADLLLTKDAATLFGRAIIQSPPLGLTKSRKKMNDALLEVVKDVSTSSSTEEILDYMEKVKVAGRKWGNAGNMPFAPQYGFAPLPAESDIEATIKQVASKIDVLIGSTQHEVTMFLNAIPQAAKLTRLPIIGTPIRNGLVSYLTGTFYHRHDKQFAQDYAQAGGKISLYRIGYQAPKNIYQSAHCIELPLIFGQKEAWDGNQLTQGLSWEKVVEDGKKLRTLWAEFAKGKQVGEEESLEGIISIQRV